MGKKNRIKNAKDTMDEQIKCIPYTEQERSKKITGIMLQLSSIDMSHVLTREIHDAIQKFIKTGESYNAKIDLPAYGRIMEINFVNNKKEETYIKFLFKRIRVDGEGNENPINKLNKIQEEILQDELYKSN